MLKIENLRKKYRGGEKYAVDGISLEVREGEVFGFLGAGILPFDEGRISICGKDLRTETIAAKMQMGYVSDNHAVYDKLTAREYLNFISDIYGVGDSDRKRRADEYMQMFGLTDAFDSPIKTFSHGMKQPDQDLLARHEAKDMRDRRADPCAQIVDLGRADDRPRPQVRV